MILFAKLIQTSLGSTNRVVMAQVRGVGQDGDDDGSEPADQCEVFYPFGLVVRPNIPSGSSNHVEAVCLRDGDELHVIGMVDKSLAALTSTDVDAGELLLFSPKYPSDTKIKIDVNGKITASAGNASLSLTKDGDIVANANGTTITVHNNGNVDVIASSGNVVSLGDTASSTKFIIGDGEALKSALDSIKSAVDALRTDMTSISTHTHTFTGTGVVGTSPSLGSVPSGSAPSSIPANSTKVKAI
jgi:hypothetical protein